MDRWVGARDRTLMAASQMRKPAPTRVSTLNSNAAAPQRHRRATLALALALTAVWSCACCSCCSAGYRLPFWFIL